jgi:hypothetical protein
MLMWNWLKNLFSRKKLYDEAASEAWYDEKSSLMEAILGKEHDMVMHAMIPYALGGALDLYYFPNGIEGVAVATKELSEVPGEGSTNDWFDCYELAMFTKEELSLEDAHHEETRFGAIHTNINAILNCIARYSEQARLNPGETCEFPEDMDTVGGKCLIFDGYGAFDNADRQPFGILAAIEVFRQEMDFARENGGSVLIERLKQAGHYPYSDLDREPVV